MIKKHNRNLSHHLKLNLPTHETCLWWNSCLPSFDFPEDLSLSTFLEHYINIAESMTLIKEITFHRWISMFTYFQLAQRILDVIKKIWTQENAEQ